MTVRRCARISIRRYLTRPHFVALWLCHFATQKNGIFTTLAPNNFSRTFTVIAVPGFA